MTRHIQIARDFRVPPGTERSNLLHVRLRRDHTVDDRRLLSQVPCHRRRREEGAQQPRQLAEAQGQPSPAGCPDTGDRVDDAVVKKVNEQLLSDLPVGDTTDFYQLGDLLMLTRRSVQPNRA